MSAAADGAARVEHDLLGEREVPADVYWGIHTLRALENFSASGTPISRYPELVVALATVKQAAAAANRDLGVLPSEKAEAIIAACRDIRDGALHDQFVVDAIQGGAGTSTNMNANEVIANRGLEHLGRSRGDYLALHPIEDVNRGQSTNDVYPTAAKLALDVALGRLIAALSRLRESLAGKGVEFADLIKMGRTQLQDAVPMTLGQEFTAYAVTLREDEERLAEARALIHEINLGGTAIGTGINAHPEYAARACRELRRLTGVDLLSAADLVEATQDVGAFVQLSGVLKRNAVKVSKICNDLRLLSSGPRAGLGEIALPAVQAGSSIMPGKVNPVIPEMVNQVAFEVIGNDVTISFAAEGGQLQLNAFEPIIVFSLLKSLNHMETAWRTLGERCVTGITANAARLRGEVEDSLGLATALVPVLGYEEASEIAREALLSGRRVREVVLSRHALTPDVVDALMRVEQLASVDDPPTSAPGARDSRPDPSRDAPPRE